MAKLVEKSEWGWAIMGKFGLYCGWRMTRAAAIAEHVNDMKSVGQFAINGKLSTAQTKVWMECRQRGDRAVKVVLSYWA